MLPILLKTSPVFSNPFVKSWLLWEARRTTKMRTKRGCFVKAWSNNGVSHHYLVFGSDSKADRSNTKSRKVWILLWKLLVWEAGGGLSRMGGHLLWLIREHIWLSLIGPELKVGPKSRKVGSHWPSLDPFELVAKECGGQSSVVIHGLWLPKHYQQNRLIRQSWIDCLSG